MNTPPLSLAVTPSAARSNRGRAAPAAITLAAMTIAILAAAPLAACSRRAAASADIPPAPDAFRPTAEQWSSLSFAEAAPMGFADAVSTDGKIATDDDATVQVTPPFTGKVVAVPARAGDKVVKGQILLTAEANDLAQAKTDYAAAHSALATARAQLAVAQAANARQHALLKIQGAAEKDVQQADSDLATAQAAVQGDEAALNAVNNRLAILSVSPGELARADALAAVKAPISGVVVQRQVGPGQYLNATSNGSVTPIFVVSDLSKVWLVANVREADAGRMHVGLPIQVRVNALPGKAFPAKLDYVAGELDPATRRLPVHAVLANPDGRLKPEMFADFAIDAGPGDQALGVPSSAVIYEGDTARVWIARPDHTLALRPVKAGRTQDGQVEILSGLQPHDRVVASGAIFIDRAAKAD